MEWIAECLMVVGGTLVVLAVANLLMGIWWED